MVEDFSYQAIASYAVYIIVACIIILIMLGISRLLGKNKDKKRINSVEKNIQLIYKELEKINEKLDRIYNNDSDDFIDK
ncbi:MAG: hypothetical protein HFI87_04275 [Bacilli bacterium]|nr:hypothetical protein [Bacilli bacterium]